MDFSRLTALFIKGEDKTKCAHLTRISKGIIVNPKEEIIKMEVKKEEETDVGKANVGNIKKEEETDVGKANIGSAAIYLLSHFSMF